MSAALQQQIDSLLKRNQAARTQLLGTDYMPDLAPDTLTAGPKGIGENLANMFGLYDAQPKLEAILKERESRAAEYNKALKQLEKATAAEVKAEAAADRATLRAEDALDSQRVLDRELEINERLADRADQRQERAAELAVQQSLAQTRALFPYLDEAGRRGTERALDASQRFAAFKQQLPLNVQRIMESKQGQLASASNAFAAEAQAIANQQRAATGFAQLGTGRYSGHPIG